MMECPDHNPVPCHGGTLCLSCLCFYATDGQTPRPSYRTPQNASQGQQEAVCARTVESDMFAPCGKCGLSPFDCPDPPQSQEGAEIVVGFAQQIDPAEYAAIRRGVLVELRERAREFQGATFTPMCVGFEAAFRVMWAETTADGEGERQ